MEVRSVVLLSRLNLLDLMYNPTHPGLAGLTLLTLLLVWFRRRHSTKSEFDGNFDPDRVVVGGGGTGG